MKKVLIADDEFLVRMGLKTTINWEENGFAIVGEAKNGKEAMELFEKHDPDILLTDIRMPIMGGLELIQELKKKKKGLKAAILSHYDDFNYAREAIKLGASEYILKSDLSSENLLETLKKLSEEIDSSSATFINSDSAVMNKENPEEMLSQEFLRNFVMTGFKLDPESYSNLDKYNSVFKYNSYIVVSGLIEDIQVTSSEEDREQFCKSLKNISDQVFSDEDLIYMLDLKPDNFILLLNLNLKDNNEASVRVYELLCSFKKQAKQFLGVEIILGISRTGGSIKDLKGLYHQSKTALQNCFFADTGILVFNHNMLEKSDHCPQVNLDILKNYVKNGDIEKIRDYISSVFAELQEHRVFNHVKDAFMDFLSYARIIKTELNLKNGHALSETKFSYSNFDKLYNINAAKTYIIDIFHSLAYCSSDNKPDSYSYIISKSIKFIKANYHKNITLSEVANHVEISDSYLSLLFKQETGINFSNFLINYRIEMSKKLLTDSNMKIYEIAEKVGFENPYYFSKVFKEVTGLTCKDYKKNYYISENDN